MPSLTRLPIFPRLFVGLLITLLSSFAQAQYSAPATSTTGTYVVSWSMSMGTVKVYESQSGGAETLISPPTSSGSVSLTRTNGVYTYKFWFCSMGGPNCALQETKTTTVSIPSSSTSSSSASSTAPGNGGPPPAPAPNSTFPVGAMAGAFRVTESGTATYSIPVAVPAGVAGVAPQLAVSYESSGGHGLVGVGANINGLGSITRCRQTLLQDDAALPITWGTNDRFCLNGQRLMLVSGTYGSSGSIYKTEIDSFVQVTAFAGATGTAGNPEYFEIEAKDGSKSTYGGTTEARLQGAKTITWTLSRFEDSVGNRIDYAYEGDRTTGHRIKTITYAYPVAKSSSAPAASVEFVYEDRLDVASSYVAGGYLFKNTKRLDAITTKNGTAIYRKYYFNYNENGPSNFDSLSRLTSAQECMSDLLVSCYPKTTFAWGSKFLSFGSSPIWLNELPAVEKLKNHLFMDVDGDGRQDFVWMRSSDSTRYIEYAALSKYSSGGMIKKTFSNGTNYLTYTNVQDTAEPLLQVLDYNADGRQDLLVWKPFGVNSISAASWDLYLSVSDNAGGWKLSSTKITMPFTSKYMQFGDLDSDGLLDAVETSSNMATYTLKRKVGASISSNTYYEFTSTAVNKPLTGAPAFNPPPPSNPNDAPMVQSYGYDSASLGDFNGDGKLDITIPVKTYKPISPYCSANCNEQTLELYTFINTGAAFTYDANYYIFLTSTPITGWADLLAVTKIIPQDFNGDGFTDIAIKDTLNWTYRINSGKAFGGAGALTNISDSTYSVPSISLLDINSDGYTDVIWHDKQNQQLLLRKWDMANARVSTIDSYFAASKPATNAYSFGDINGDGFADMLEQKVDSSNNVDIGIFTGYQDSDNLNHIYQITDGNQRKTNIIYGSLSNSKHYTTLQGVNTNSTTDPHYCTGWPHAAPCTPLPVYVLDTASFYSQINRPFGAAFEAENPAPILELAGSLYVVTEVNESAPIANNPTNTNKVTYHYHHARIQAGGRGYLGFEKLTTIDQQTGVRTETTYHQDWPYTGSPKSTVVKTKEGHKLSESTNVMATESHANPLIHRVYLDISTEVSYSLKDNGATQGSSLQTMTTDTDYDEEGNVERIQATTSGNANTSVKTVTNTFSTDAWEKRMGRLLSTTTTTQRNSEAVVTRQSSFEYHGRNETWPGMLKTEIIEPGANQLVVTHVYDDVGNKKETIKTAQVKPGVNQTRKTIVEYDASKRFAKTTKDSLGNVTSGVISYHPVYGSPTELRDANGVSTLIDYYDDGSERLRSNPTGAWSHSSRVFCNENGVVCVAGARYRVENLVSGGGKSIEYIDVLGRVLRSTKILFDGRESHVDTEYDHLSRVKRQSTPYTTGETPYWTVFDTYDLLGRPTKVTAPDGTVTTTTYDGYKTTVIADVNGKALKREEERNSIGHLVKVTDNLNGTITYGYDALGNLTSATTTASGTTVRVRMCYDKLGRKFAMHDPDKGGFLGNPNTMCTTLESLLTQPAANKQLGWWYYRYNDFGELIEQTDTKKQTTVMDYDELGRMKTRTDKFTNGTVDSHTRWYYDKNIGETTAQTKNQFKLMAVVTSYGSINENCSGSNYCQTYLYDNTSRLTDTATYLPNHTVGYINTVKYDSIGRVYETRDVLNGLVGTSGTTTIFNSYGYASEVRDLASGDVLQKTVAVNSRGQVTEEWRNNGGAGIVTYQYDDKTGAMKNQKASIAGGLFPIQDVTYEWDVVGNLKSRWNQSSNVGRTAKKNLQESFCYDGLNRLIKSYVGTLAGSCSLSAATQDMEYDGLGNITRKTGVGTYTYSGKGPHAVTSTTNDGTYTYDNNGNQTGGVSRTIAYSSYDQPTRITKGTTITEFGYGPDRSRWQRIDTKGSQKTLTQYLGNVERIDVEGSNIVEWKRYIAGAIYTVRTTAVQSGGAINYTVQRTDKSFAYNDHLGSLDVVVNNVGQVTHTASFDAWGNRRNAENWTGAFASSTLALTNYTQPITQRGYTGHEMLDDTGLIHMNGRIFDPRLARFMQADPFIQAATNTQSYNRYSYVINNPLNATDPSGYMFEALTTVAILKATSAFNRSMYKKIGYENSQVVISIGSMGCGYFAGFCAAAGTYDLNRAYGASSRDSLKAAVAAGISAAAFQAIGSAYAGNPVGAFVAGGFVGGVMSELQGGKFGHGFIAAGLSSAAGAQFGTSPEGMLAATVIGGTVTEMTGGKFANGAATAAFSYAMTWAAQKYGSGGTEPTTEDNTGGPPKDVVLARDESGDLIRSDEVSGRLLESDEIEVTSHYGRKRTGTSTAHHGGVDVVVRGPDGRADQTVWVLSVTEGTVVQAGYYKGEGNMIVIRTPKGNYARYMHMSAIGPYTAGQQVMTGDYLGMLGGTGTYAQGPHLHFQISTSLRVGMPLLSPGVIYEKNGRINP